MSESGTSAAHRDLQAAQRERASSSRCTARPARAFPSPFATPASALLPCVRSQRGPRLEALRKDNGRDQGRTDRPVPQGPGHEVCQVTVRYPGWSRSSGTTHQAALRGPGRGHPVPSSVHLRLRPGLLHHGSMARSQGRTSHHARGGPGAVERKSLHPTDGLSFDFENTRVLQPALEDPGIRREETDSITDGTPSTPSATCVKAEGRAPWPASRSGGREREIIERLHPGHPEGGPGRHHRLQHRWLRHPDHAEDGPRSAGIRSLQWGRDFVRSRARCTKKFWRLTGTIGGGRLVGGEDAT